MRHQSMNHTNLQGTNQSPFKETKDGKLESFGKGSRPNLKPLKTELTFLKEENESSNESTVTDTKSVLKLLQA